MSDTAADRFRTAAERFSTLVGGTTDWSAPTPVDQWRARDVVEHLTTWLPGMLAGCGVALDPGPSAQDDPAAAWEHVRGQVHFLLDDPGRAGQEVTQEHLGTLPLERLVDTYYTPDVVMHSWDLARSSGQDDTIDPDFVREAHAGMLSMEPMIRGSGQYGEQHPEPEGASEQERFLAFIGRDPRWSPPT